MYAHGGVALPGPRGRARSPGDAPRPCPCCWSPLPPQEGAERLYNTSLDESKPAVALATNCTGREGSLRECATIDPARSNKRGACGPGGMAVSISCGPFDQAGPELCFLDAAGKEQCWNRLGFGTGATMACGTAGRRQGTRGDFPAAGAPVARADDAAAGLDPAADGSRRKLPHR